MSGLRRASSWIGLAVALLVLLVSAEKLTAGGVGLLIRNNGPYVFTLLILLLVTSRTRTAGAFALLSGWLFGALGAYQAFRIVGDQFADSAIQGTVWVPVTEELIKAGSVLLLLGLAARSRFGHPSATDGLLIGYLVGWGASFTEDASTQILRVAGLAGAPPLSWLFPFLDTDTNGDVAYVGGHAAWAALTGGAIGIAFVLWQRNRWIVGLPLAALALAMLDHGLSNEIFGATRLDVISGWALDAYGLILDGRAALIALAALGAAAVVVDRRTLRRSIDATDSFQPIGARQLRAYTKGMGRDGLAVALAAASYNRLRAAVYFAVATGRFERYAPERQQAAADTLLALCRSVGVPITVIPDHVDETPPDHVDETPSGLEPPPAAPLIGP